MLRTAKYLLIITVALGTQAEVAPQSRRIFVLSPDAAYVSLDPSASRVDASGRIAELRSIDRVYPNPFGDDLFIQTSGPETEQLAVVTAVRTIKEPSLQFTRWIRGLGTSSNAIWAKALSKDLLLVSWQDELGRVSTVFYNPNTNAVLSTVRNFIVTPTTCVAGDGQTVYAVSSNPRHEIKTLNLKSLAITDTSYDSIGSLAAYYKAPVAADGCMIAFIERPFRPSQGPSLATIYFHDVEKRATLGKLNIEGEGRFFLAARHKLLLLDQTAMIPNKLPDGTTVGLRRVTTGNVFVYDVESGKQIAQISVPKEGELAGVSSDGNSAYYISPNLLTVIDLVERRVTAKVDLPFSHGMLALGRSTGLD